LFIITVLLKS